MNNMDEDTIDLLELARALWKNILIIALVAVVLAQLPEREKKAPQQA